MSSSNRVRLAVIEEASYGVTPVAGNFDQVRFTSEGMSGSPDTVESELIRTDRMSSGQVVVGLSNLGGEISYELAKDALLEKFMASAMMSDWVTPVAVSGMLAIDVVAKTITQLAGNFNTSVKVGDMLTLAGFVNSVNNTQVMVTSIESNTEIKFTGSSTMVDEEYTAWATLTLYAVNSYVHESGKIYKCLIEHTSGTFADDLASLYWLEVSTGLSFKVADYLVIGSTKKSFSIEKAFLDLTTKGINYRGMLVNEMALNIAYGAIVNGSFSFSGNDYVPANSAAEFMTNTRTINAAATTNSMNGSVDMPFIASEAAGVLDKVDFCIQEIGLTLNNNLTAQNCIGSLPPKAYTEGQASIEVNLSSYLSNENWDILEQKLSQTPFGMGFAIKNSEGFYGFYLPAIQVSMDDPASGGRNQDVILSMTGVAKVGTGGLSALRIYRA